MDAEVLNDIIKIIDGNEKRQHETASDFYLKLNDALTDIVSQQFYDLNSGKLFVFPFGDLLTNSFSEIYSTVDFYIIYKTDRENINFAVIYEKINKKGKKRVSTYQSIVGSATKSGKLQAEDVAERISYHLKGVLSNSQTVYLRRNIINIKLNEKLTCRIFVGYDCNFEKNNLKIRRVNRWYFANPIAYLDNFDIKEKETKGNYSRFCKLLKALELELVIAGESNLIIGNNYFVENLLFNVPNNLFLYNSNVKTLNAIINFIKNKDFSEYELMDGTGKMFNESSFYNEKYARQFINKIIYADENIEEVLQESITRDTTSVI